MGSLNTVDSVWAKVKRDPDGCWLWQGAIRPHDTHHYGVIGINYKVVRAHRAAYESANGAIPEGMSVLHSCDNTLCCRPSHLFLGTQDDNIKDMWSKGRAFQQREAA